MTKQSRNLPEYNLEFGVISRMIWFREELLTWFRWQGRDFPWREPGRTAYEILIAEILLQRTTAAKVAQAYDAFLSRYPSWSSLTHTNLEKLQELLKPLGLWLQKSLVFRSLAEAIETRGGLLPESRAELEQLPGIGQYIANAVLLTFYKQPEPLIDVNMARVLERFFGPRKLADIRYDPYLQTLARYVVSTEHSLQVNWAILDLGALICKHSTPLCLRCPLQAKCEFHKQSISKREEKLSTMQVAEATIAYEVVSTSGTLVSLEGNSSLPSTSDVLAIDPSPTTG